MNTEQILLSLTDLRHNLRQAQFPLDVPEAITQAGLARRIANQLNDYILPRLETIDAPLLAVVVEAETARIPQARSQPAGQQRVAVGAATGLTSDQEGSP